MGTEIIGTEEMAKVVEEVENGTITKVKVTGVEDGGRRWNQHPQYPPQGYSPGPHYQDPNHYQPPPMGYQG